MLTQLMQERQCDAPDVLIKASHKLISKYNSIINSIINKYNVTGDKLINFLAKREPKYKQIVNEYLSLYS